MWFPGGPANGIAQARLQPEGIRPWRNTQPGCNWRGPGSKGVVTAVLAASAAARRSGNHSANHTPYTVFLKSGAEELPRDRNMAALGLVLDALVGADLP